MVEEKVRERAARMQREEDDPALHKLKVGDMGGARTSSIPSGPRRGSWMALTHGGRSVYKRFHNIRKGDRMFQRKEVKLDTTNKFVYKKEEDEKLKQEIINLRDMTHSKIFFLLASL